MFYGGASGNSHSDQFRTAAVDTIVAEIQSVPGEDRCVLLLGYKNQIEEMFQVCAIYRPLALKALMDLIEYERGPLTTIRH